VVGLTVVFLAGHFLFTSSDTFVSFSHNCCWMHHSVIRGIFGSSVMQLTVHRTQYDRPSWRQLCFLYCKKLFTVNAVTVNIFGESNLARKLADLYSEFLLLCYFHIVILSF